MNPWYIYNKNQHKKYGPYSSDQLKTMIQKRNIDNSCAISSDGVTWYSANEMATKFANLPAQKKIGKFEIIKELGRGGMGVVYHARDVYLQHECAVKFIRLDQGTNSNATKRFITEAQSIAKLNHPNIIKIKELNNCSDVQGNNLYYFSMDYIKGISFKEYMNKKVPLKQKLEMLLQVCLGIAYAHKEKIIHRDLKPENIMVSEQGIPIILDFGLARNLDKADDVTKTGDIIGTPKYIAPEIMRGEKADERCDVYALGVILYEMLTGFSPFTGDNVLEVLFQVSHTKPIAPSRVNNKVKKDSDIETICLKCLEKKSNDRLLSVDFLCEELKCVIEGKPISTKPPSIVRKSVWWLQRNKLATGVFTLVVSLLILLVLSYDRILKAQDRILKVQEQESENKRRTEIKSFSSYANAINNGLMQLYEKYYDSRGINSILSEISRQYSSLENKIHDKKYEQALTEQKQNITHFLNRTNSIMRYFLLPSIPKILKSIELQDIKGIYQIASSSRQHIAFINNSRKLYLLDTKQVSPKNTSLVSKNNFLTAKCDSFCFSPDGTKLATLILKVDGKRSCCIYDVVSRDLLQEESIGKYISSQLAFSPNSRYIVYAEEPYGLSAIDTRTKKVIRDIYTKTLQGQETLEKATNYSFFPKSQSLVFRIENQGYYLHNFDKKVTTFIGEYKRDSFPIQKNDKLIIHVGKTLDIYDTKTAKKQRYTFTTASKEALTASAISPNQKTLLWGSDTGAINYVTLLKDNFASTIRQQQNYSPIHTISFAQHHFFFTIDKENHFYLRDLYSKETIYQQPNVYHAHYDKTNNIITAILRKEEKFYFQKWQIPFSLTQLLQPSADTLKVYQLAIRNIVNEDLVSSGPSLLIKKNGQIQTVMLPWYRGISIWEKHGEKYINYLKTDFLSELWDMRLSPDNKWIATLTHNKKLRKQQIILLKSSEISNLDLRTTSKIIDGKKLNNKYIKEWQHSKNPQIKSIAFSANNELYFSREKELWLYSSGKVKKIYSCRVKIEKIVVHPTKKLIAIGQKDLVDIIKTNGQVIYKSELKEEGYFFKLLAWHPTQEMLAVANTQQRLYLISKNQKSNWQQERITIPGGKFHLSFSPNGKMLAIFTSHENYIYSIKFKIYFPIFPGYHKNSGANFCSDWQYAAFPTKNAQLFLFDLQKLNFENFPEYFSTTSTQNQDPIWPRRIQKAFQSFIKQK
ncbi:protein kinase [Candidatus Uabimicrobium sp. HlEnr_7]|uniref:serine/threonine protein kinase n=1 Tax=Candidatus Uabimicrobium helgolandensis TaxID=3095367 RepID=UPI0035582D2A